MRAQDLSLCNVIKDVAPIDKLTGLSLPYLHQSLSKVNVHCKYFCFATGRWSFLCVPPNVFFHGSEEFSAVSVSLVLILVGIATSKSQSTGESFCSAKLEKKLSFLSATLLI